MKSFSVAEIMKSFLLRAFHTHQDRTLFTDLGLGLFKLFLRADAEILKQQIHLRFTRLSFIYSLKLGIFFPYKTEADIIDRGTHRGNILQ